MPIKLREGTPLGALVPVTPEVAIEGEQADEREPTGRVAAVGAAPTVDIMRKDLEAKGISLADTALRGEELDQLIRSLYENMDIMATSIAELPGTDIMRHRIETGDSTPIRKRAYRHSPQDMAEISRQTKEC
jgi:hypothetical protein